MQRVAQRGVACCRGPPAPGSGEGSFGDSLETTIMTMQFDEPQPFDLAAVQVARCILGREYSLAVCQRCGQGIHHSEDPHG